MDTEFLPLARGVWIGTDLRRKAKICSDGTQNSQFVKKAKYIPRWVHDPANFLKTSQSLSDRTIFPDTAEASGS